MQTLHTNIPVAMVFFARPEQFKIVFECVRKAKPSKLFLIQDGPRNAADEEKIAQCREIAESVDWDCEVYRNYSDVNLGCGQRIYTGLKWAFEHVDRLVILEDDCVPSPSFFPFCEDLLERYKDDLRIRMISGMNHLGEYPKQTSDYFFSYVGSIAGWATWKRCWDAIDFNMEYLHNKDVQDTLDGIIKYGPVSYKLQAGMWREKLKDVSSGKKQRSWSFQFAMTSSILNSQMVLVPTKNLMTNIGAAEGGTNTPANEKFVPKATRRIYHLPLYEYTFPLRHPLFVVADHVYNRKVDMMMRPTGIRKVLRRCEVFWLRLRYGGVKEVCRGISRKMKRLLKKG